MTDLVARIAERIDHHEATARAATPGPWEAVVDDHGRGRVDASIWAESITYYVTEKISSGGPHIADAEHIALNGPSVALVRCTNDRRTLARHAPHSMGGCTVCEAPHWGFQVCNHCHGRAWPCEDITDLASSYGVEV
ncbi:DUF6221 family protein [Streptomyces rubiginosohelvolus]|uniref:DUF6221 family protein n=1 Tax=Streptomyces rubiginosohelvolus TaxID=67362 RepID=UPI0037A288ED